MRCFQVPLPSCPLAPRGPRIIASIYFSTFDFSKPLSSEDTAMVATRAPPALFDFEMNKLNKQIKRNTSREPYHSPEASLTRSRSSRIWSAVLRERQIASLLSPLFITQGAKVTSKSRFQSSTWCFAYSHNTYSSSRPSIRSIPVSRPNSLWGFLPLKLGRLCQTKFHTQRDREDGQNARKEKEKEKNTHNTARPCWISSLPA